jgi:hypothetical protein
VKNKQPKTLLGELATKALSRQILTFPKKGKPGEIIGNLPADKRKILEQLKSDDIKTDGIQKPV